jgi:hypothetical protein
MFPKFRNEFGLSMFKSAYCLSKRHTTCARHQSATSGVMPPGDLLPNGRRLAGAGPLAPTDDAHATTT